MARGKWWEYLIPGHNVGLMVGDVYDSITGNSEKNAGTGVFGTRKNDSNSYQYAQSNACRCLFGYIEVFGQVAGDFAVLQLAVAGEGLCILQITRYDNITRADAAADIQLAIFQGQKCIGVFYITAHCAAFGICYYLAQRAVALQTQADALVILHCCGQQQRAVHRTSQSSACQMGAAVLFSCFLYQISGA